MRNLNEIRIMQHMSVKRRIPEGSVPEHLKKAYKSLVKKGLLVKENNFYSLVAKNSETE